MSRDRINRLYQRDQINPQKFHRTHTNRLLCFRFLVENNTSAKSAAVSSRQRLVTWTIWSATRAFIDTTVATASEALEVIQLWKNIWQATPSRITFLVVTVLRVSDIWSNWDNTRRNLDTRGGCCNWLLSTKFWECYSTERTQNRITFLPVIVPRVMDIWNSMKRKWAN